MKLSELIAALEREPQGNRIVVHSPSGGAPGRFDGYRGYYAELAIEPGGGSYGETVGTFLARLRAAVGTTIHGYKGGEFEVDPDKRVWLAEHGDDSGFQVSGVVSEYGTTRLLSVYDRGY